ncbi:MAG: hypothetical protein LBR87_07000, partial [Synergistaceae bacterium]|nr:hypothetical protein [Synergistaceae bacterium]
MLALHGCYRQGFFLWGERPLPGDGREDARHPDGGSPCEPGEGRIPHALAELGFEGAGSLVPAKLEIYLPSCAEKFPVPSTPLLGEIPRSRAKCSMRAWHVEAVSVSVTDLVALRPFLVSDEPVSRDGRFLANGVMSALDLCYIMECCSFVLSLLKRGRFLPDIRASKDKYEPVWVPMLIGDDSARYSRMMRVMPDIIKTRGESFASGPRTVLGEMISALVDGLVRHAWSRRIPDDRESVSSRAARAIVKKSRVSGESVPERRKRGRLVNALNPHALWIRSLGWFGETDGLSQSLGSIYSDVREWMGRYEWSRHAPYRLRLELSDSGDIWRLEYSLKCFDSGEIFKASDVWFGACAAGNPGAGGYMRRCMLQALGNAGSSFRPIRD